MTILAGDIKLLKADTMSDVPEGGGAITGAVVMDGVSNNIFDDISTLDRVYGAVHMRKVFPAVQTQDTERYFGSHVILTKLPGDAKIGVNLFNTGDYFDRRPSAQSRVENYRAQGVIYSGFLWGTQYQGSRAITIFQGISAALPGIGDVLKIVAAGASQYIRIVRMTDSIQEFVDSNGAFQRRILEIEISDVLIADFIGSQISRVDILTPAAALYKTVVANAARYYSARPLALAADSGDLSVKVDSVYSQVVPSSQSELALVDISAAGHSVPIVDAAAGTASFSTSVDFVANSHIYLGNGCLPGSLSIPVSGSTLVDDGGNIKSGTTVVGTINYAEGVLSFGASSPTYSGAKTVTFRPAAAPVSVADTTSIRVTAANRGYVWTINLNPPPKPGALSVSYRALNKWYELHDNAAGGLIAQEAGIGSGSVNYVTGSVSITTAVYPDADSDIILAWGKPKDYFNRAGSTVDMAITHQIANPAFVMNSIVITAPGGFSASVSAQGVISGSATGTITKTGAVRFMPAVIPAPGTVFTFTYSYGPPIVKHITAFNTGGGEVDIDLGDTDIVAGSLKISWETPWIADPIYTAPIAGGTIKQEDHDNGTGGLWGGRGGAVIDYATGIISSFDPKIAVTYKAASYIRSYEAPRVWGIEGPTFIPGKYNVLNGYFDTSIDSQIPAAVDVTYRTATAGSTGVDMLTLANFSVDLSYLFTETIVPGSLLVNIGGRDYIDRLGQLYYNIDRATGSGTYGGTLDYTSGIAVLTAWVTGAAYSALVKAMLTTMNFSPVEYVVMRTPAAPVKPGVYQVRATPADGGGLLTATADNSGVINSTDIQGFIDYDTGVVKLQFGHMVTAAGNESQPWYDAAEVVGGQIFKPRFILAETIIYDTVAYTYLPLSAVILGLDPVRLPANGKVPIYAPGDVVVVLHDQTTTGTYTNGAQTNLGRGRIAKLTVRDSAGQALLNTRYTANLDTGIISWVDLSGVSQPLSIVDRIEDMAVVSDVQITGVLTLSQPLTHDFPAPATLVSNAIVYGTLYARTSIPFDQQTWTGVWSDVLIGSGVSAQYNNTQYPIVVDNASCIQERWHILFTSSTAFNVIGEHVGQIVTGGNISSLTAPINPNTAQPYFSIPAAGWGSGWSAGNVLRFNTYGANAPTWIIEAIAQGEATSSDYTFCLEVRGDIDTL